MKKILKFYPFFILLGATQIFVLIQWLGCADFTSPMHFSLFDLQLRIIESIHNDQNIPLNLIRMLHNKVVGIVLDVFMQYLQFWNVLFLSRFISLVGVVGVGVGAYYFFSGKKNWMLWLLFAAVLLVPFLEVFGYTKYPYLLRLVVLAVPVVVWSMWGYWHLLREKKLNMLWIVGLIVIALWYQLVLPGFEQFCFVPK